LHRYAAAIDRRCSIPSPGVAADPPLDCGLLALEILGLERELSDLRAVFAASCIGSGTP
jgi:hypothetical protein